MVQFAPFDYNDPPQIVMQKPIMPQKTCTECNMVVVAFIAGVFLMALFDALK
jgi:hypothetical protein